MRVSVPWLLLAVASVACGPTAPGDGGTVEGLDTSEAGLVAFIRSGGYTGWTAEPTAPLRRGVHGPARVFFNDTVVQSLRAGNSSHPRGSILVKEFYADDGTTLKGHALNVKVEAGTGKDTWLFFEGDAPGYANAFYGRGHATCHGCHEAGRDYVTSALP
jgi:hypothetical protein